MSVRRIWTPAEANALVPRLSLLVGEQMRRAFDIDQRLRAMRARGQGGRLLVMIEGEETLDAEERALRAELLVYEDGFRAIEELGVTVKDPRIGLCDFLGQIEGRDVWLCWRYGERAVEHWHELDQGFSGRKPIGIPSKPLYN
ncbi:DUF2203 domain-containing protein [Polyangium jinanense]|uniref:DUF2203 domain-containing protein n=1 Tax=Polyangium jinanense TaxID=2829994 RepID=A0A9X3WWH1_9BACT|nr:DUF2203 domain-containing protein [Polyangium jinanense]MDC3979382.1 DUF2203 domain-containing protein [Polyangium jinanense]